MSTNLQNGYALEFWKELTMSDRFLETDELLQSLINQLEKFKSASQQLSLAEDNVGEILDSCGELLSLCEYLIAHSKKQIDIASKLAQDTEHRTNLIIDAQQASMSITQGKLDAFASLAEKKLNTLAYALTTNERTLNNATITIEAHSKKQFDATSQLAQKTEECINEVLTAQKSSAASSEEKLTSLGSSLAAIAEISAKHQKQLSTIETNMRSNIEPLLYRLHKTTNMTRFITFILLASVLVNGALAAYIVRLLSN